MAQRAPAPLSAAGQCALGVGEAFQPRKPPDRVGTRFTVRKRSRSTPEAPAEARPEGLSDDLCARR